MVILRNLFLFASVALAKFDDAELRLVRWGPADDQVGQVSRSALILLNSDARIDPSSPLFSTIHPDLIGTLSSRTRKTGPGFIDLTDLPSSNTTSSVRAALEKRQSSFPTPTPSKYPALQTMFGSINASGLKSTVQTLSNYATRYYKNSNARAPATWIQSQFTTAVGSANVKLIENSFDQPNVIATIPRKSGSTNNEVIIIGAHLDSINQSNTASKAPGADDDASGIAVLIQAAQLLAQNGYRGTRAIEFHAYAGEEGGLLGSARTASQYKSAGKAIRAMLQMDMVGYQNSAKPVITSLTDTSSALVTFSQKLVSAYIPEAQQYTNKCGYACSDHFSWNDQGYASISIDESGPNDTLLNPYYHTTSDTIDRIDFTKMSAFVKLALAWAVELSE